MNNQSTSEESSPENRASETTGLWLAIGAAVGYSITNLLLRRLAGNHPGMGWDILISAGKSLPTAVTAWLLVLLKLRNGTATFPSPGLFVPLFIAALVMQFGGNVGFQVALGHIGLAVTVPLVFACIICAGAFLGRSVLGDPITFRSLVSVALMMIAIVLLSSAASSSAPTVTQEAVDTGSSTSVFTGVLAAIVSGLSYGANGVVIRRYVRDKLPVESTLLVFGTTGIVFLGSTSFIKMGTDGFSQVQATEWLTMLMAGCFNAAAFFSVTYALKLMSITRVNVINASQNAMCAIGAVLIFSEPPSYLMGIGVALTMFGLAVLDRK